MSRPSRRAFLGWLTALALLAAGGPAPAQEGAPAQEDAAERTVYVVSIGWHTGIAIPRDAIADSGRMPEIADFPDAQYIEVGWGDRNYYMHADPSVFDALGAGIGPSPAVLHVIGMAVPPQRFFVSAEVIALPISAGELDRLIAHIDGVFDRPADGAARPLQSGLVRGAFFYPAHGEFHLFNTCNTWAARALSEAGLDISAGGVMTADDLMSRVRELPGARPAG
jgi:uncharacterized protein (TIGR02117 family)